MLRTELEEIVKQLGLQSDCGNSLNVIMEIYREHKNNKYFLDGEYYSTNVLGKNDINKLNEPFKKLLNVIKENKLQVRDVNIVENGAITAIILYVKKESLTFNEKDDDFEIETNIPTNLYGSVNYDYVIPERVGFGTLDDFDGDSIIFRDALSKKEKEKIINNLDEIFDAFNIEENLEWVLNYIETQNDITPVHKLIDKKIVTQEMLIESIFENEEIYSNNANMINLYTKLFKFISTLQCSNLDINKNSNFLSRLPDFAIENTTIFKNILENWDFDYDSGQKVLTHMANMLYISTYAIRFKSWIMNKPTEKYYFDSWDLQEMALTYFTYDFTFIKFLFENRWIDINDTDPDFLIDFIRDECDDSNTYTSKNKVKIIKSLAYIVTRMTEIYNINDKSRLLEKLLMVSNKSGYDLSIILKPFIDNFNGLNFKIGDGEIMKYLSNKDQLKHILLSDSDYISYLISKHQEKYLPQNVTDIFLF